MKHLDRVEWNQEPGGSFAIRQLSETINFLPDISDSLDSYEAASNRREERVAYPPITMDGVDYGRQEVHPDEGGARAEGTGELVILRN